MSLLAIRLPNEIARLLSEVEVPGEKVSREEMHITMLYLGKETPIEQLVRGILATFEVTSKTRPFTVRTSRVTAFPPNPDDGTPIICPIESPELHALRKAIVASFQRNKVEFSNKYPQYKPHVTLAYSPDPLVHADHGADRDFTPVEWGVGEIILWGGNSGDDGLTVTFPLSMQMTREAVYRSVVRLVTNLKTAHDANGQCAVTCPCHTTGHPPDEVTAKNIVQRYLHP